MSENINKLNEAWIEAGQKVTDLDAKLNIALLSKEYDKDAIKDLSEQRDLAKSRRDAIKDQMDEARANEVVNMKKVDKKPLNSEQKELKDKFVHEFKNMVTTGTTGTGNGGLTIPDDVQTTIHTLVRQYASLQNIVNVEAVSTETGSRVYEKWSDIKPLTKTDEGTEIQKIDDPELLVVHYLIKKYAGISQVTNELLKDSAENILAWITTWISRKVVVTRNNEILRVLDSATKKPTVSKFDDVKDMVLNQLDPALQNTAQFLTNQSGFAVLAKVKDGEGRYMIQRDVTQPEQYTIEGKPVMVVADRWLPDVSGTHPLYFGDFKQAVTLFDREDMQIATSDVAAGSFENDTVALRVIDRFDVQATDTDAYVVGSFNAVSDQPTNAAGATK